MADFISNKFRKRYCWPKDNNIRSLFRFSSFDPSTIVYHKNLFIDGLLYHSLPSSFNDPFECRPVIQWPRTDREEAALFEDVVSLLICQGLNIEAATELAVQNKLSVAVRNEIENVIFSEFQSFRICCFTKRKDNLLFWSHYANSHTGYCVEYDTENSILAQAYKVRYGKKFPTLEFPLFNDIRKLSVYLKQQSLGNNVESSQLKLEMKIVEPVLNKSQEWRYEEEYRSVFKPGAPMQLRSNNESIVLTGNEIKHVYFGCNMPEKNKQQIISLIEEGPFSPVLWQARMKVGEFALTFEKI
jgi:hypothetical protein